MVHKTLVEVGTQSNGKGRCGKRAKSGQKAIQEIRLLQSTTHLIIPKISFSRFLKEITNSVTNLPIRWATEGVEAIQGALEAYLIELFEDA